MSTNNDPTAWRANLTPEQIETVERAARLEHELVFPHVHWERESEKVRDSFLLRTLRILRSAYPMDFPEPKAKTPGKGGGAMTGHGTAGDLILFLDIDGVLNGHDFCHQAKSCLIRPDCVARLNRIVHETGCKVVLSSAWRYMIYSGAQTVTGFEYMLRTHGATEALKIVGITVKDEEEGCETRGKQIRRWLDENGPVDAYVVVDDDRYDIDGEGPPLVQTDGKTGLTDYDAQLIIEALTKGIHAHQR